MLLDDLSALIYGQFPSTWIPGTNLFLSQLPEAPDNCLVIFEYGGQSPTYTMGRDVFAYELPRFQVQVRSTTYQEARTQIEGIRLFLAAVSDQQVNDAYYLRITASDSVMEMEPDAQSRKRLVCNFEAWKTPSQGD